jgi:hypothetical protein
MKVPTLAATDIDAGAPGAIEAFGAISANTRAINYMGLPSVRIRCLTKWQTGPGLASTQGASECRRRTMRGYSG